LRDDDERLSFWVGGLRFANGRKGLFVVGFYIGAETAAWGGQVRGWAQPSVTGEPVLVPWDPRNWGGLFFFSKSIKSGALIGRWDFYLSFLLPSGNSLWLTCLQPVCDVWGVHELALRVRRVNTCHTAEMLLT
jgi:hypothetical protein